MDSTPANGVSSEDDISSADIVISLTTGRIVTYIVISIVIIAMLGVGIYYIKARVLPKKGKVK